MEIITADDLPEKVRSALEPQVLAAMLAGANARAARVAPCLLDSEDEAALAEARLILLGAIQRWAEAGSGAFTQQSQTAGPFTQSTSFDNRQRHGFNLWPSEIEQLQGLCDRSDQGKAFTVDTAPTSGWGVHLPWCSVYFGSTCSCGANIAGHPIYERESW